MRKDDRSTFGNLADWKQMARAYNYLLYTKRSGRQNYKKQWD